HEHPQVARRREESAKIAAQRGIEVSELTAVGDLPLERLASLVHLIDYASVYLAIAGGIDPPPIPALPELKARIAQEGSPGLGQLAQVSTPLARPPTRPARLGRLRNRPPPGPTRNRSRRRARTGRSPRTRRARSRPGCGRCSRRS